MKKRRRKERGEEKEEEENKEKEEGVGEKEEEDHSPATYAKIIHSTLVSLEFLMFFLLEPPSNSSVRGSIRCDARMRRTVERGGRFEEFAMMKFVRSSSPFHTYPVLYPHTPTRTHTYPPTPTQTHTHPHTPTHTHTHPHTPTHTHTHPH